MDRETRSRSYGIGFLDKSEKNRALLFHKCDNPADLRLTWSRQSDVISTAREPVGVPGESMISWREMSIRECRHTPSEKVVDGDTDL